MKATGLTGERMTLDERRAAFWLAGAFSLRMLGLFMILPVFALYADIRAVTPALAGAGHQHQWLQPGAIQIPPELSCSDLTNSQRTSIWVC
ncbi:MAG: hypothetical protein IPL59_26750 [Candidatus Competibacteraceae bacterium]|nr:hypothetical protein [Candidatus Competibacteraceae bacterium]